MTQTTSDAVLLERFRRGDAKAFDAIVRQHRREVYRVARRVLGSHEDADEATQETFVRAWKALGRFRGDAALRTWLIRIVVNAARTLRSRRVERPDPLDAELLTDPAEGADVEFGRRQIRKRVRAAVDGLPPRQREVVLLKVFSEMTYRDVATAMELTEGAVKAHFHQAVSNLRRRMAGGSEETRHGLRGI